MPLANSTISRLIRTLHLSSSGALLSAKNFMTAPGVVQMRAGEELPIVITADKAVPYGDVAAILGQLKQESGSRVGLLGRPER